MSMHFHTFFLTDVTLSLSCYWYHLHRFSASSSFLTQGYFHLMYRSNIINYHCKKNKKRERCTERQINYIALDLCVLFVTLPVLFLGFLRCITKWCAFQLLLSLCSSWYLFLCVRETMFSVSMREWISFTTQDNFLPLSRFPLPGRHRCLLSDEKEKVSSSPSSHAAGPIVTLDHSASCSGFFFLLPPLIVRPCRDALFDLMYPLRVDPVTGIAASARSFATANCSM